MSKVTTKVIVGNQNVSANVNVAGADSGSSESTVKSVAGNQVITSKVDVKTDDNQIKRLVGNSDTINFIAGRIGEGLKQTFFARLLK